jgi:hypothetical protein
MAQREDGRFMVSYSETKMWSDCPHRWRAFYELGARNIPELNPPSQALAWGSAFHDSLEAHLQSTPHCFDTRWLNEFNKLLQANVECDPKFKTLVEDVSPKLLEKMPAWLSEEFGKWTFLGAEIQFEMPLDNICSTLNINDHSGAFVKGFIDCILQDEKGKIWLLDWKTSEKGWSHFKRKDEDTPKQLQLYKACFITAMKNAGIDIPIKTMSRMIGTEYIIVRPRLDDKSFERYNVSSGETSMIKTVQWLHKAVRGMQKQINFQNTNSCRFCPLAQKEEWCDIIHHNKA